MAYSPTHLLSPEEKDLVKRVIGLPGDVMSLSGGYVYVDGKRLDVLLKAVILPGHEASWDRVLLTLEALGLDENHWPGGAKNAPSMAEFFLGSK